MKTKGIVNLMVFSGLCFALPYIGHTQERLFRTFAAETYAEMPVLSSFISLTETRLYQYMVVLQDFSAISSD